MFCNPTNKIENVKNSCLQKTGAQSQGCHERLAAVVERHLFGSNLGALLGQRTVCMPVALPFSSSPGTGDRRKVHHKYKQYSVFHRHLVLNDLYRKERQDIQKQANHTCAHTCSHGQLSVCQGLNMFCKPTKIENLKNSCLPKKWCAVTGMP